MEVGILGSYWSEDRKMGQNWTLMRENGLNLGIPWLKSLKLTGYSDFDFYVSVILNCSLLGHLEYLFLFNN